MIGCAADIAINAFNAGDLNLLFLRAGLKPESGYGKSALVSNGITAAVRAADRGDRGARVGLNEFVRLVAERVAPRAPDDLIEEGTVFWRLREATRSDGFDLKAEYSPDERARLVGARFLPLDEPAAPLSDEVTALEDEFFDAGNVSEKPGGNMAGQTTNLDRDVAEVSRATWFCGLRGREPAGQMWFRRSRGRRSPSRWSWCGRFAGRTGGPGSGYRRGFDRIGEDVVVAEQAHQRRGGEEGFELVAMSNLIA